MPAAQGPTTYPGDVIGVRRQNGVPVRRAERSLGGTASVAASGR